MRNLDMLHDCASACGLKDHEYLIMVSIDMAEIDRDPARVDNPLTGSISDEMASFLQVRKAWVLEIVHRLIEQGYLRKEGRGVVVTDEGRRKARLNDAVREVGDRWEFVVT